MTIPAVQAETAEFLAGLTGAAPIETHISAVYVGADAAYKLKKAVRLTFLDFTALADRERLLRRELAINTPHAPALYRAVRRITRGRDGRLELDGAGPPIEWVLEMASLKADAFLHDQAIHIGLSPSLLDSLGDAVAAMHEALAPVHGWDVLAAMGRVIEGNSRAALAAGLPSARIARWTEAASAMLKARGHLLQARAMNGLVRRCHGDLHLGNICLWEGQPAPFDALEFDEALATIDTGYDLAFLLLDLEVTLDRRAANRVFNRYVARTGDVGMVAGLPLWLSLRAIIRAHVEATRGHDPSRLLAAAEDVLRPAPARAVAIGGLQGTGKSRLARAMAPELGPAPGALILRNDEARKRLFARAPEEKLPPEAYAEAISDRVHARLFADTALALGEGHAVIADATFLDPDIRQGIEDVARRACGDFIGLWLDAPIGVLRSRIAARRGDASDATETVLLSAAQADPGEINWLRIDASEDPVPAARAALAKPVPSSC